MNVTPQNSLAIQHLGYTDQEAQFLNLVAAFSGYFVPRQFVAFARVKWGKRSANFSAKLERRGHATWREYLNVGGVYRLSSKALYRVTGRESLRHHRTHSIDFIRTRILLLDFVLAHQGYDYLENDEEKVRYFHQELGLPTALLPSKQYARRPGGQSSVRYFVDKFPVFFETPEDRVLHRATLSYVDPGAATLAGFCHYLSLYGPLLRALSRINVVYISSSTVHFAAAEKRFRLCVAQWFRPWNAGNLLRYFRLRSAWDAKKYGSLSTEDIEWLEQARTEFSAPEIDDQFAAWAAGSVSDEEVTRSSSKHSSLIDARFYPHWVARQPAVKTKSAAQGEA